MTSAKTKKLFKSWALLCLITSIVYASIAVFSSYYKLANESERQAQGASMIPRMVNQSDRFYEKYNDINFNCYYEYGMESTEKWIIERKIANYNTNLVGLKSVLLNIVILIMLGILVIFYRPAGIEVSFIKLKIPEELLYILIAIGLIYTWSNFGLEFNSAIDSRLSIHHNLMSVFGPEMYGQMSYEQRPLHLLADNALIDNWTAFNFDIFVNEGLVQDERLSLVVLALGLFGLYGTLLGLLFATFITVLIEFSVRLESFKTVAYGILLFGFALIYFTNIGWVENHDYSGLFSAWCWITASIFIYIWQTCRVRLVRSLQNKTSSPDF